MAWGLGWRGWLWFRVVAGEDAETWGLTDRLKAELRTGLCGWGLLGARGARRCVRGDGRTWGLSDRLKAELHTGLWGLELLGARLSWFG